MLDPLFVKDLTNKVYIVLFSCAVSRALHLEIVRAMNTDKETYPDDKFRFDSNFGN